MAGPTKTVGTQVLSLQEVTSGSVVISSEIDVTNVIAAFMSIHFGRVVTTALTAAVVIRLEARTKATGPGYWFELARFTTGTVAAESEALSNNESAGATVLEVASTTNLNVHDQIFIKNSTIGNSDWQRIAAVVTNTSIALEDDDGLRNGQNMMTLYNQAERFAELIDLSAVETIRLVVNGAAAGQNFAIEALMNTLDSFE